MNVLFLDIDGVLNSEDYFCSLPQEKRGEIPIDERCLAKVAHIVDRTGAVIVLTSSWRGGWDRNPELCCKEGHEMNRIFGEYGLEIYDKTPVLPMGRRPDEIKDWISHCGEKVGRYVILDDYDFFWKKHKMYRHWVKTDYNQGGLSAPQAEEAIRLFNGFSLSSLIQQFFAL